MTKFSHGFYVLIFVALTCVANGAETPQFSATQSLVQYYERLNEPKPFLPRTGDDFVKHRDWIRSQLLEAVGLSPLPERIDLNPQYSEPLDHPWCTIYKVAYQIWPEIYTTCLLYIPKTLPEKKVPGILCPHGHFQNGYYHETVHSRCLGLANLGYIVLATPQDHYEDFNNYICNQTHMMWRNIRGLDFLQSLPQVDHSRLGAAGVSGGGLQIQQLLAVDDRVKAATIAGLTCDFRELNSLAGHHCACNHFPKVMRFTDQPELSALAMPCAVQYLTMNDWTKSFEANAFKQVKALYEANGCGDKVDCRYENTGHEYGKTKREWTCWWLEKHLRSRDIPENGTEPQDLHLISVERLQALKVTDPGKPLSHLSEIYRRKKASVTPEVSSLRDALGLGFAFPSESKKIQTVSSNEKDGIVTEQVLISGEGPLTIPLTVMRQSGKTGTQPVVIVLLKDGTKSMWLTGDANSPESWVKSGHIVVIPDIRFVGQTSYDNLVNGKGNAYRTFVPCSGGGVGNAASVRAGWNRHSVLWGRPITGMRVTDIQLVSEYIQKRFSGTVSKDWKLCAMDDADQVAAATFAAAVFSELGTAPRIAELHVNMNGASYASNKLLTIPGILRLGDLPDWIAMLSKRGVKIVDERHNVQSQIQSEVLKDWVDRDALYRATKKVDTKCSPAHTAEIVESATQLANRLKLLPNALTVQLDSYLRELEQLRSSLVGAKEDDYSALYMLGCQLKRQVVLCNPHLQIEKLLFLKRHNAKDPSFHMCDQFYGFTAVGGGGLYALENLASDSPKLINLLENAVVEKGKMKGRKLQGGAFLSPEVSYDGKKIFFAYCEAVPSDPSWKDEKSVDYYHEWSETTAYHIFSCNADGSNLVQLTDGSTNDFDPCELPDGRIAFISERRGGFLRCGRYCPVYTLYSMEPDGSDIVCLSYHETHEWQPSVNNDGTLVYTRWDYVDRDTNIAHHIWTCFPDGRDPRSAHGNYPLRREGRPWMEMDIRAIPGSEKHVATAAAHHGHAYGSLVLIDQRIEDDGLMSQLTRLTPDSPFPEAEGKPERNFMRYGTPYPFSEQDYLCVYGADSKNRGIYWIDSDGNKELLYRDPAISTHSPLPLQARTRPPIIPEQTTQMAKHRLPGQTGDEMGTVGIVNIYESDFEWLQVDGKPVEVASLRIVQVFPKTTPCPNVPRIGVAQQTNARGVLGTVPVEKDGSAFFEVPPGKAIYFQALDKDGRAVQSMRSATYLHPGEQLTCIGCHENKRSSGTRASTAAASAMAFRRSPSAIEPDVSGSYPINYVTLVQPVLDAHCIQCHGDATTVVSQKVFHELDLTGKPWREHGWSTSYSNLAAKYGTYYHVSNGSFKDPLHGGSRSIPGKFGAVAAPLAKYLTPDHYGVTLTQAEKHRLELWLDCNSEFYGTYENVDKQQAGVFVLPELE